jgi:basic amino acid/polyamine antiporter, APA family
VAFVRSIGRWAMTALVINSIIVSTYSWISADILNAPRLAYSLAAEGDFPGLFARVHPRFYTPATAIVLYALTGWVLAVSGTFLWAAALSAGSTLPLSINRMREESPAV